jgi:RimJ/RimL family protein N-acetyltransferase
MIPSGITFILFGKIIPTVQFHLLEEKDLPLFVDFESAYLAENSGRDIDQTEFEYSRQMLRRFQIIPAKVGYFTLEGKVIGYSFGEVRGDTLFLHIEKALHAYPGIYQALESRFLQEFPASVIYVNREDDANNLGLREAKLQLHPCAILDKCFFEVLSPIDLVKSLPTLQGKSVYLAPLKKEEEEDWAKLNLDDELNRYWGYDYRCDLPKGVIPYAAYFAADLAHDFLDKNGISLFVHDLAGTFLGEVTLYHFTNDKGAEMGIRLKKEAQKHGFAFETVNLVIAYAQTVLGLRYLNYESFLQNAPSIHLAEKAGFEEVYQDRLKRHFRKLL